MNRLLKITFYLQIRKLQVTRENVAAERVHLMMMKNSIEGDKQLARPCSRAKTDMHRATGRRPNLGVEQWTDVISSGYC